MQKEVQTGNSNMKDKLKPRKKVKIYIFRLQVGWSYLRFSKRKALV